MLPGGGDVLCFLSLILTIEVSFQEVQKKQCFAFLVYFRLGIKMGKQGIINEGGYL